MKKITSEKVISAMSFTVFALLLAEAYLNHKDEISESFARLKSVLGKGNSQEEGTTENAE